MQGVPAGAALQVVKAACPAGGPGGWLGAGGTEGGISEVCEPRCPETRVGGLAQGRDEPVTGEVVCLGRDCPP